MRVLILANGDPPSPQWAQRIAAEHDLLLATDGAAHLAADLGLEPDIICGDFDSIRLDTARADFPNALFLPTPDQEQADLEKALVVAQQRGATAVTFIGATGSRLDHTLSSLALLLRCSTQLPLCLRTENTSIVGVSGTQDRPVEHRIFTSPGDTISLISFDGLANVTLTGVRWPLLSERLRHATHGVSNVATGDHVTVLARGGAILLCHLFSPLAETRLSMAEEGRE